MSSIDSMQEPMVALANLANAALGTPTGRRGQADMQYHLPRVLAELVDLGLCDPSDSPEAPPWIGFITAFEETP